MTKYYNKENLNEIADGDQDFLQVLAQTFLDEIPPDLYSMKEAIENDNRELAYQFAHKMKPNIEMFGIDALKDITSIEAWSKTSKNKATVIPHLENVLTTLKNVFEELKKDFQL
ncbi:Hpt domain-containing protein [Aequorivita sp. F47161]|jgi:HPt (histidine-containing phosphotransfer) domain-containing protein|uniref:Hpt domain-containing protein n=1 Tax=Aequorivita vitellina TaxID=2874475 RepID=A0A9X1UAJ5_9FLAO|nr:Hpt domain-containing protein [Aequorivita vitellina]MCG2419676.1 Hpt domain-containing protein [Aequorivita vitellina]MCZ4320077.1 Hpt domain-containing protein [Aequorivita viscosa]